MTKGIFLKLSTAILIGLCSLSAQSEGDVDAIEKARQAKEAADKAAADAAAATEAAIEAAAAKAAKEAREDAKRKKEEEEARKAAEAAAAEEAELDAAAQAAAAEAKRKMAAELGLDYVENDNVDTDESDVDAEIDTAGVVEAKESLGINLGLTGSVGFLNGEYITNTPVGASLVITTPYGFQIGGENGLSLTLSFALGSYNGNGGDNEPLNAFLFGAGANATLFDMLFSETHASYIGAGMGVRHFSGVSLERILQNGLNLPVNVLIGAEGFLTTKADEVSGNTTYWGGLGVRLDYSF